MELLQPGLLIHHLARNYNIKLKIQYTGVPDNVEIEGTDGKAIDFDDSVFLVSGRPVWTAHFQKVCR